MCSISMELYDFWRSLRISVNLYKLSSRLLLAHIEQIFFLYFHNLTSPLISFPISYCSLVCFSFHRKIPNLEKIKNDLKKIIIGKRHSFWFKSFPVQCIQNRWLIDYDNILSSFIKLFTFLLPNWFQIECDFCSSL